jgi:hypothetical protein
MRSTFGDQGNHGNHGNRSALEALINHLNHLYARARRPVNPSCDPYARARFIKSFELFGRGALISALWQRGQFR